MSQVVLVQGTALHVPLRDASVHCCVTSPPYFALRNYGMDGQLGLEETPAAYVEATLQVFREVKRVLRPDGTCWVNMGDSYNAAGRSGHGTRIGYKQGTNRASATGQDTCRPQSATLGEKQLLGMPWRLAFALQADGWYLRSEVIWHKPNPMPESVTDRPTRSHEQVFLFSKQPRYFYDAEAVKEPSEPFRHAGKMHPRSWHTEACPISGGTVSPFEPLPQHGRNARSVWSLASEPTGFQHYAAFPQALVRRCLLAGAPTAVCAACSSPYRRVVEPTGRLIQQHWKPGSQEAIYAADGHHKRLSANSVLDTGYLREKHTTGFAPTCACAAGTQPATILDPFCGSGTTLLVARELGHHAVGIDLSYPYLRDIARARLGLTALAVWEGRQGHSTPALAYTDLPLFGGIHAV